MRPIQVPMALRAELKLPIGPIEVPFRTALMLIASLPLVLLVFTLPLTLSTQALVALGILGGASVVSRPNREGVWVGTWAFYRLLEPLFPQVLRDGRPRSAAVRQVGAHLRLPASDRAPLSLPRTLAHWSDLPRLRDLDDGLIRLGPDGGWHAVLALDGPRDAPLTQGYERWCQGVVDWINTVGAPAQLYTEVTHYERLDAQQAFEASVRRPRTKLIDYERQLAGQVAERSLAVRQYVVLSPRRSGPNGVPTANRLTSVMSTVPATRAEAERMRDLAVRQGDALGVGARLASQGELRALVGKTALGCQEAVFHAGEVIVDGRHSRVGAVIELPTRILPGAVMSAIIRARIRGSVSFHILPVQPADARKELKRQESLYRAMFQRSRSADVELLYHHARKLDEMLLSRQTTAMRVALTFTVTGDTSEAAALAFERLQAALLDEEMTLQRVTTPTTLVASTAAPGGRPLNRSLFLTTGEVAAYLLAGQGSAFGDPSRPLIGIDAATTATCWYSVFDRTNFSALILGSSGAGKSVAAKTLLMRHHEQGADVLVVDPESEYELVVTALGGQYVELGDQSLNAFAVPLDVPPEVAAGTVTRVLSVMGGEERDYQNNRPVRSLAAQDMAWLFGEVVNFFHDWRERRGGAEPVLSNFCDHLEGPALRAAAQLNVEGRVKRCADIAERLRAYTQGDKGRVFNRPSSVSLTGHAVGVGLYHLANQLRADLTPALAFVLAALLGELQKMDRRRVILVDEAHKVLSDPDAGEVLADVVRTSRKRGAGVWMASQSIRDFLPQGQTGRPSPGEVLATVAATKLILGVEHGLEAGMREAFGLSDAELAAITTQRRSGRGVLIAEQERAIVDVLPGEHLLPVVSTSSVLQRAS
ncbi:MAG: DUF87 domain-containing protein [Candidatus Dormibacteraeota bacterium]|nr:DUF87 domain-containing protein [Candidatus Dormibacteraeota bacterium]